MRERTRPAHGPFARAVARLVLATMLGNYPLPALRDHNGPLVRINLGAAAVEASEIASDHSDDDCHSEDRNGPHVGHDGGGSDHGGNEEGRPPRHCNASPSPTFTPLHAVPTATPTPTQRHHHPTPTPPAPTATPLPLSRSFDLTGGQIAWSKDRRGTQGDQAFFHFLHDPALAESIPDPRCPATSSIRIFTESQSVETVLPCENWTRTGSSYQYRDPRGTAGGVTSIKVGSGEHCASGELRAEFKGKDYGAAVLQGPAAMLGLSLTVAESTYCGIFTEPPGTQLLNEPEKVLIKGPSVG